MGNNEWLDIEVLDDYLEGKLDASMMHKVERVSLEDPFVAQALAGLTEAKKRTQTLSILQKQLQERVAEKPVERKMWRMASHRLSIAATAAVLFLTVSVLFWMRENQRQQQAEIAANQPKNIMVDLKPQVAKAAPSADSSPVLPATAMDQQKVEQALDRTLNKGGQAIASNRQQKVAAASSDVVLLDKQVAAARLKREYTENQMSVVGPLKAAPAPPIQALESKAEGVQPQINAATVSGKVLDYLGRPIPGANVKMVGEDARAITNVSGEFVLPAGKKTDKVSLEVASLGYDKKNIEAKANEKLNIRLEESNHALNEVAVVGYGEAKRKAAVTAKNVAEEVIIGVPEMGWKAYNEYLQKNNQLYVDGTKTVVLSFKILADGTPSEVKVVKSERKEMDEEAVRLLKNGGKWKLPTGGKTQTSISIKF